MRSLVVRAAPPFIKHEFSPDHHLCVPLAFCFFGFHVFVTSTLQEAGASVDTPPKKILAYFSGGRNQPNFFKNLVMALARRRRRSSRKSLKFSDVHSFGSEGMKWATRTSFGMSFKYCQGGLSPMSLFA